MIFYILISLSRDKLASKDFIPESSMMLDTVQEDDENDSMFYQPAIEMLAMMAKELKIAG